MANLEGENILFYASDTTTEHNNAIMAILDGCGISYQKKFTPWDPNFRNEVNYGNICGLLIETQAFLDYDIAPYVLEGKSVVPFDPDEPQLTTVLVSRKNESDPAVLEYADRLNAAEPS